MEDLFAEAVVILVCMLLPCAYIHEQMEFALQEVEVNYHNGRFVSHSSIS